MLSHANVQKHLSNLLSVLMTCWKRYIKYQYAICIAAQKVVLYNPFFSCITREFFFTTIMFVLSSNSKKQSKKSQNNEFSFLCEENQSDDIITLCATHGSDSCTAEVTGNQTKLCHKISYASRLHIIIGLQDILQYGQTHFSCLH